MNDFVRFVSVGVFGVVVHSQRVLTVDGSQHTAVWRGSRSSGVKRNAMIAVDGCSHLNMSLKGAMYLGYLHSFTLFSHKPVQLETEVIKLLSL